jgi:hypothetical protein
MRIFLQGRTFFVSTFLVGSARCADRGRRSAASLPEAEQREHAAGFSFFGAVGIVQIEMAGGADAAVVDLFHALGAALLDDLSGEIDFVMGRSNAGTKLDDHVRGLATESRSHLLDCFRGDGQLGSFFSGMDEADGGRDRIDNVNGAAIGHVNAEGDAALIGDETVATRQVPVGFERLVDNFNLVAVNLVGREQRPAAHTNRFTNFMMNRIESAQDLGFVVRDIDAGDASGKSVPAIRQLI